MASADSHEPPNSFTIKTNYPIVQDIILYFGIVVDDTLDTTLLKQKAEELVGHWPILGGFMSKKTKPYTFSIGKNVDVKSRMLNRTGRESLPILYECESRQPSSPLVFSANSSIPDTLFHFDTPSNKSLEPLFTLRITSLQDVTLLGFRCPHYFVDSQGMFDIIKAYSALVSGKPVPSLILSCDERYDPTSNSVPDMETRPKDPVLDFDGHRVGLVSTLLTASHMLWKGAKRITGIIETPEERYVYVPKKWIDDARQHAIKELAEVHETKHAAEGLTKHDILTAWFLKCSYQNSTPDNRPINFYYSLNWSFALPPLPDNESCPRHTVYARLVRFDSLSKLQHDSLAENALTVRQAVNQARTPSEIYRALKFIETNLTNFVTLGGPDIDLNWVPILSSSTAMPFCELDFRGASTTGSEAKVIYVQPWAPLAMWLQFVPFSITTKDGKGGYWMRMVNVPQAWKGFPTEVDA